MKSSISAAQIKRWFTTETGVDERPTATAFGEAFSNLTVRDQIWRMINDPNSSSEAPAHQSIPAKNGPGGGDVPPRQACFEYPQLPITKDREKLVSVIEHNSVVIVRGATGCGKSTLLPQFILDHYKQKGASCNIAVTQPRKIGASSIARWVAAQQKCALGGLVGYQVALDRVATEYTRLTYMTTGVVLQKLVSAKSLTEFSHIFVDEVHERSELMDCLLLILKKLLHTNSRNVKIILMSATINCDEFAEYFATPIRGEMFPAYVFEVEGTPRTIQDFYLDDLQHFSRHGVESPHSEDLSISAERYGLAVKLIQSFDELEDKAEPQHGLFVSKRGSVLVFLPGLGEIIHMQEALTQLSHTRLQVHPLHSSVTLEDQNSVFQASVLGYRKVILSTNIAESSVTVPDVKYVIDFCLARHLVCDKETNYQSLCLTWAAKTNCNQRRGRAGRVSMGYCYRLVTREFWETEIPEYMTPEMLLAPLSSIVLNMKLLDMGQPRVLLATALSPPKPSEIVRTLLQLKEMGALSTTRAGESEHNEDGDLTFLGRVLAHLPVDVYLGKMIVLGHAFGCLNECLIAVACHSLKSFFAIPSSQQLAGHRSKLAFASGTQSDSQTLVNAFKEWQTLRKSGRFRNPKDELEWGKRKFIQIKRIREVAELYEDLKKRVSHFNMRVPEREELSDYTSTNKHKFTLQVVVAGAYYPHYFKQVKPHEELASRELLAHDPKTTVMVRSLPPYSFLYYKQLQALLQRCGQVKSISFDSSRAFVEFGSVNQECGALPEVSLALLLAQSRPPPELSLYRVEEIERVRGKHVSTVEHARVNVDFESQSISPVPVLSSIYDPEKLPRSRVFAVSIAEVMDVGHFWGFQADKESLGKQLEVTAKINALTLHPITSSLYPNMRCLAPYAENKETLYYRAKILRLGGNEVQVFFLDFGNTYVVPSSSLREAPTELWSLPFQALEFQLAGIRPSAQSLILGDPWSSSARRRFAELVEGREVAVSLYSIVHHVMRVDVLVGSEKSESVADVLVREGHAATADESLDSKQSHDTLVSLYQDVEKGTYAPNIVSGVYLDRQIEEEQLIGSLVDHFCKRPQSLSRTKMLLRGPNSPYIATFSSLSQRTLFKAVVIDRQSINATVVDENPQNKHARMLVAGNVLVSTSGSSVVLRDTTLMPDIPGLPAITTMLFTPMMELRVNEEGTRYTGALCGMGWDSRIGEEILPDHDIELPFDVQLDADDIIEINALRAAINQLLCEGPASTQNLGTDRILHLQEECRECLMRLFTKSRENTTPVFYERPGKWNQVDPSLKMEFVRHGDERSKGALYQPHAAVLLNT